MFFDVDKLHWTRKPLSFSITKDKIEIITSPCGKEHIITSEMIMLLCYK